MNNKNPLAKNLFQRNYKFWLLTIVLAAAAWFGTKSLVYQGSGNTTASSTKKSAAIQLTGSTMPTPPADGDGGVPPSGAPSGSASGSSQGGGN